MNARNNMGQSIRSMQQHQQQQQQLQLELQQQQQQQQHLQNLSNRRNGNVPSVDSPYPENGKLIKIALELSWMISKIVWILDPPTYEQALTIGDAKFSPNYPVYRRQTSYSSQTNTPVMSRHCTQWTLLLHPNYLLIIAFHSENGLANVYWWIWSMELGQFKVDVLQQHHQQYINPTYV